MTRMMTTNARTTAGRVAAPVGVAAALIGTLTGCSAAATAEPPAEPVNASYRDGTYEAVGPYESPNGSETITVSIELASDIVTDVVITTNPTNPTTANYQSKFADGIGDIVIGQDIDSLNVTVVAGSSLTGNGFREALTTIKAEALDG